MVARIARWKFVCAGCLAIFSATLQRATAQPLVAPSEALSPAEEQQRFHLPPGFEIQLFASEPAIHKPMNLTFDSRGRLFVTDTLEYPYPAKEGTMPRDTVKILVDHDGDGAAEDVTTFVDRLNIPLGVMPIPGGAIVYGIPAVMRCMDTDGDGKADTREPIYANFGHRDTHGMVNSFTRGLDSWLYACHGFSNDSSPQGKDGQGITMNSGNTFRMRLDGSHLQYVTHGQVNPFGLAFDPLGNLYSADCHTMPIYMLLRGAFYPSFGKAHDGLGFGPTMIGHSHGSTGIGGIAYYAAEQFPPEHRDTILIGNPVTGKVNQDRLKAHGSTYEAVELPDFITCDDPWFRPVNLQVGPDGALYVADFYNCVIGHYEVPLNHPRRDRERGRIWRVVYTGKGVAQPSKTAAPTGPNVSQASLAQLIELLDSRNFTVRSLATDELVDRIGKLAVEALQALLASSQSTAWQRVHGMWALDRLGGLEPAALEALLHDASREVRLHACKVMGERSADSLPMLRSALKDPDAFVRRAAADALGRHPRTENVEPLLELWSATPSDDTHLIHVARMALRDQLLKPGVYAGLTTIVAGNRDYLDKLANVSLGVPNADSAALVWQRVRSQSNGPNRDTYLHHVARYLADDKMPELYALARSLMTLKPADQAGAAREIKRGTGERGATMPDEMFAWGGRVAAELLNAADEGQVRTGIEIARDFHAPVFDALARTAGAQTKFQGLRPAAIDACMANDVGRAIPLLADILANAAEPMKLRQQCATALARNNDDASRGHLIAQLQTAPEQLAVEIANALADSPHGAEMLLATVTAGKASPRLLQEATVVTRLRARKLENLDDRLTKLTAGLPPQDDRIRELIAKRRKMLARGKPDLVQGAAVFKKNCAICHRIGDEGSKIGPNLDGVGIRGVDRVLEDLLDPSRNVDQAFRTTQIVTADGRIISGLALREEGKVLILADAQGKEVRLPQDEIDQRTVSQLSLMPANVPDLVSEPDFVHLLGYLMSQREAKSAN